jgi:hypothetical protein
MVTRCKRCPTIAIIGGDERAHRLRIDQATVRAFSSGRNAGNGAMKSAIAAVDRATLPDPTKGFDDPRRLDAFLDAVRWGAVGSADVRHLNAPFRSGITIEDYQLDPVVRALQMPRANLLIADDVGLGKTIEAGLVLQEIILRHRARSVLVVCPAG